MDVDASGPRLYIADAFAGLRMLDVSDPARPREMGAYAAPGGDSQTLAVSGGLAYVADINQGLHVVDVSAPAQPRVVGIYSPMGYSQAVEVAGRYAYVGGQVYGLRVIDLADPARPREVATFPTSNTAVTVALSGSTAYLGTNFSVAAANPGTSSLHAVDVTDPLHPKAPPPQPFSGHKGNATFQGGAPLSPEEIIYSVSRNMFIQGTTLYNAGEWGLLLVDISNPLAPCELGFLQTLGGPLSGDETIGVAVTGNNAYLAARGGGLYTVDVSNPRRPTLLGTFAEPASPGKSVQFTDVAVGAGFAYVIDTDVFRVVDISDPKRLRGRGAFKLPAVPISNSYTARQLAVEGNRVFVADSSAGLLVMDVSDPDNLKLAGQLRLPGLASWVSLDNKYAYVAAGEGGLFIIQRTTEAVSGIRPSAGVPGSRAPMNEAPDRSSGKKATGASMLPPANLMRLGGTLPLSYFPPALRARSGELAPLPSAPAVAAAQGAACDVTSSADAGPGTLRACVRDPRVGTITFDHQVFPPDTPATIRLTSGLTLDRDGVTIDGSNAGVILEGDGAPPGTSGLSVAGGHNTVRGLQIVGFTDGIVIGGSHNTIGGDRSRGKGPLGEGNIFSGNRDNGINLKGTDNRVVGNYIGVDLTGTKLLDSNRNGIGISGHRNLIGGPAPADRNVISGSVAAEIIMEGASGNRFIGNYIGTDASGKSKLGQPSYFSVVAETGSPNNRFEGNVIAGVILLSDYGTTYNEVVGNRIGTDVTGTVAFGGRNGISVSLPFNRIGGTRPGEGNVINGAIDIFRTHDVFVLGNLVGTDSTGKRALGTSANVGLGGAHHNFIGGTTEAERNVINNGDANIQPVSLGDFAQYNFVLGNYIGADATGAVALANFRGVALENAEHNFIQRNVIMGGRQGGVRLAQGASFNWLRANRITRNTNFGIEVAGGEGNVIAGNSFIQNGRNASDSGRDNRWDDGALGNYWSDYAGRDANGDGIGDTPYPVTPNGADRHPLMVPP